MCLPNSTLNEMDLQGAEYMRTFFETDYIGKYDVCSHYNVCVQCRQLTVLSSYTTTSFAKILGVPLLPIAKRRILDECPKCGSRGVTAGRKYAREKKHNLALMMDGFAAKADNPSTCSHALHTLMIYDEASWFTDVQKSYGLRFDTHPQIQYLIAQGLCRFGEYDQAIVHCRKSIVLGAGKPAEKLLSFCQKLLESTEGLNDLDALRIQPESARTAYIPLASIAASLTLFVMIQGIIALRTHTAWLVNGSLQQYTFTLDKVAYTLPPGNRQKIKMRTGKHQLQVEPDLPLDFTYTTSKFKQLIRKELLVINPDAMALLTIDEKSNPYHAHGRQIHTLSGAGYPLFGLGKQGDASPVGNRVSFYRPETHMALVNRFHELSLPEAAKDYARKALVMNPETHEASSLLEAALKGSDNASTEAFLRRQLSDTPALLPWHLYFQNHIQSTQPEHTLIEEYTTRLKNNPEEPEASYLLGRVINDPEAAQKFFLFSEHNKGMNGLGYYAIARDLFHRGEFQEALFFSKKSKEKNTAHTENQTLHEQILLALKKYDELVALNSQLRNFSEDKNILYLTCAGYHQEAEAAITAAGKGSAQRLSELDAVRYYAVGNMRDYVHALVETGEQTATFQQLMHQNNISEANHVLTADENHLWSDHLVLYCGAKAMNEEHIADVHLRKAAIEIGKKPIHLKRLGLMLESSQTPDPDAIKALQISAPDKALLCTTLGFRFPEMKPEYHALAQVYNFTPAYPQILMRRWTHQNARQNTPYAANR